MKQSAFDGERLAVAEPSFRRRLLLRLCRTMFFALTVHLLLIGARAQTEELPDETVVPPPLKILSKTEKSQIAAAKDMKERTKLALVLMEARLSSAETFSVKEQYRETFDELGGFNALVDDTLDFLKKNNNGGGKVLSNFKRIELSLRKYITRLELIRRDLPIRYESYVRELIRHVRDARTEAVEPLFDDSVVPHNKPE